MGELHKQKKTVVALGNVAEAMRTQEGEASTAQHLRQAIESAKSAGADIADTIDEMVVARGLSEALTARAFSGYGKLLDCESKAAGGLCDLPRCKAKDWLSKTVWSPFVGCVQLHALLPQHVAWGRPVCCFQLVAVASGALFVIIRLCCALPRRFSC